MDAQNVAIVGAGIIGLAHAWSAAQRGHQVTIFERNQRAVGASIRNFGMIWPIGQPAGEWHEVALESRGRWLQLRDAAGIWVNPCGSIHLAHRPDEWTVLQEFEARAQGLGALCSLLTPAQVLNHTPGANPKGLMGGLFSPTELGVNPRLTVQRIPNWLAERYDVRLKFGSDVQAVMASERGGSIMIESCHGPSGPYDRVVVCSGVEFQTLFPNEFANRELKLCKLQMLKTAPQPAGWKLGPHLASGLTLRHYRNFEVCTSLAALAARVAAEAPDLDRFGIHVMAAQNDAGEIIFGDSHEYDQAIEPFDKMQIDELILHELAKVIQLPKWTIAERWHGLYAKNPNGPVFEAEPSPRVHICTGIGGSGMTMSLGLAERAWRRWSS